MSILKTNAIQTVAGKPLVNTTGNIINVYQNIDTTQRIITPTTKVTSLGPLNQHYRIQIGGNHEYIKN